MRKIDRFDKYMNIKGLNDNKVTVQLGLTVGVIGKSRKEGRDLSDNSIERILNFYADLNRVWLMTGEGEMLKSEQKIENLPEKNSGLSLIPILPISAQGGSLNDFVCSVQDNDCERIISPIRGADFAITVSGDSMAPDYPSGSQVLVKKINERAFIEWGRVYVLDTCNGSIIKMLMPSGKDEVISCVSINKDYPSFEVDLKDVYGIYRVLMLMTVK